MANRVLSQRLEDQRRHEAFEGFGLDFGLDAQPLAKSRLLNLQVAIQELHFLA